MKITVEFDSTDISSMVKKELKLRGLEGGKIEDIRFKGANGVNHYVENIQVVMGKDEGPCSQ